MSRPDLVGRNTHLIDWLSDGHTHCQHGSQKWCEGYLHNARDVIKAQDAELSTLRSRCDELEADIETFWKPQFDEQCLRAEAAEAARDEAVRALEPFAKEAEAISKAHLDGHCSDLDMRPVAVGHLRAAARALTQSSGKEKGDG